MFKADKSSESSVLNSNFLCDGAKNRPTNLGFLAPALSYIQTIYEFNRKISRVEEKLECVETKVVKFLFLTQIFYVMAQKIDPPT